MKVSREKIKMFRARNDEKQSNLAKQLGISTGQYSYLENNPEKFTDKQLTVLSDYLKIKKIHFYEFEVLDELQILLQNKRYILLIGILVSNVKASAFFLEKINQVINETVEKFFKSKEYESNCN